MRQKYVCGIAIAAALGFAPPANAGIPESMCPIYMNYPTLKVAPPKVAPPKVTPPKVTLQTRKARHEGHTSQTTKVTPQAPTAPAGYDLTKQRQF